MSAATYLVNNGVDLYTVQRILRHRNIQTTEGYAQLPPPSLMPCGGCSTGAKINKTRGRAALNQAFWDGARKGS